MNQDLQPENPKFPDPQPQIIKKPGSEAYVHGLAHRIKHKINELAKRPDVSTSREARLLKATMQYKRTVSAYNAAILEVGYGHDAMKYDSLSDDSDCMVNRRGHACPAPWGCRIQKQGQDEEYVACEG